MNKLREKFDEELGLDCLSEKCEQITDDFSVKFAEWCDSNYSVQKQDFNELLQIFKEKYYETNN